MKSYLELISVSARVRRKQALMIRLCIIFSVFLIAGIFGMADMYIRSLKIQTARSDGAWHAVFRALDEEQAAIIKARPEVERCSRYAVTNYRLDMGYFIDGTETVLCGMDEEFMELFQEARILEGAFPQNAMEVLVTESMRKQLMLSIGDTVTVTTQGEALSFQVRGFVNDTSSLLQRDAYGLLMGMDTYLECFGQATEEKDIELYVEFVPYCRIQDTIGTICGQMGIPKDEVAQNTKMLALLLQSNDTTVLKLYTVAVVLAVLVVFAGVLMIWGSLNSNVAQRTQFFGMMRCLGATGKQVKRFVRLEALSWCRTAIPVGLLLSVVLVWVLCAVLKVVSPMYFNDMPVFAVSVLALVLGTVIGMLTVLLAARSPAKRAAKVSPLTSVSGNAYAVSAGGRVTAGAGIPLFKIETTLGIRHAVGSKKNLLLLSGSYAFSILLFLSFSTGVDFMEHALTVLRPYTPDVSVVSPDNTCSVPDALYEELKENEAVKRIFGRSFAYNLPAVIDGEARTVDLISYEDYQFGWAGGDLLAGDLEAVKAGNGVCVVADGGDSYAVGDSILIKTALGTQSSVIEGLLAYAPFQADDGVEMIICSEELFRRLTGETGYTILDIQLRDKSDSAAEQIRETAGEEFVFSDRRKSNSENRGVYYLFALFIYGFLAVVALISVFNIVNSIAMSVSARMRQYGAMRAVGITVRQLKRMLVAETAAYLVCGLSIGLAAGLPLHYLLFYQMITFRWGDAWRVPVFEFGVIAAVLAVSAVVAVIGPMKRIRGMSVVETIGTQ